MSDGEAAAVEADEADADAAPHPDPEPEPEPELELELEPRGAAASVAGLRAEREEREALERRLRAARTAAATAALDRQAAADEQPRHRGRLEAAQRTHASGERRAEQARARLGAAKQAVAELEQQAARDADEAAELHVVAEASRQIGGSLLARCEAAEGEAAALAESVRQLSVDERVADTERRHQDSLAQSEQLEAEAAKLRREVGIARYMQTLYWEKATKGSAASAAGPAGRLGAGGGAAAAAPRIAVTEQQVDSIRAMLSIDD